MKRHNQTAIEAGLPFIDKAITKHGFNRDLLKLITEAKELSALGSVAKDMIDGIGGPFATAIGPMRSGTDRTFAHNLLLFDHAYDWFTAEDNPLRLPVFYQLVFEQDIHRIRMESYVGNDKHFIDDLFGKFYKLVMHHENLHTVLLMPDWDKSHGAMIEFNLLNKRRVRPNFIEVMEYVRGIEHLLGGA